MKRIVVMVSILFVMFMLACAISSLPQTPTITKDTVPIHKATALHESTEVVSDETIPSLVPSTSSPIPNETTSPLEQVCTSTFERRELKEPYQRRGDEARFTLSAEELSRYLGEMGIKSVCIPLELGSPFVNVDWNGTEEPGTTGRMLSIGFEYLYPGAGWSEGYLLYATYDFATGSEYDHFSTEEDWHALQNGAISDPFEVPGAKGFVRIMPSAYSFGLTSVYLTYVFPSKSDYVAVVYNLGGYDLTGGEDTVLEPLRAGIFPIDHQAKIDTIDFLARQIQFVD